MNDEAWKELLERTWEVWEQFRDGRKVVHPWSLRVLSFERVEPEVKAFKCPDCHGEGREWHHGDMDTCVRCDGTGEWTAKVGPGVTGPRIVVEEAKVHAAARVSGKVVSKIFVYRRGLVSPDNRTGGWESWKEIER